MNKLTIKINLNEKSLYFNKKGLKLKNTLMGAEKCVQEKNGEKCVDIIYDNNKDLFDQALEIINFRNINGLEQALRVRVYEHKNDAVQIIGNYDLEITKH
jgi:hypothetical protein